MLRLSLLAVLASSSIFASALPFKVCSHELSLSDHLPISVSIGGPPAKMHAGNYGDLPSRSVGAKVTTISQSGTLDVGMEVKIPNEPNLLLVDHIRSDGTMYVMRGLLGRKRYFKKTANWYGKTILVEVEAREQDAPTADLPGQPLKRSNFRNYRPEALVTRLAAAQERASLSYEDSPAKSTHLESVEAANRVLVDIIFSERQLSVQDLARTNSEVTRKTVTETISNGYQMISVAMLTGIVRGTEPKVVNAHGQEYLVDLSALQMFAGEAAHYIPAVDVPEKLNELVTKVNQIDVQTRLFDIVGLYRDFLIIHPFIDGNGRTSRILLDYMLLKAQFRPAPHDPRLTKDVLFFTPEETYVKFIEAYNKVR